MTDSTVTAPRGPANGSGEVAMSRLAERLAAMAPPLRLTAAQVTSPPQPSRSILGTTIDGFVAACSIIPYAAVALAMRLIMARLLFLDGQTRVDGIKFPINVQGFDFSFVLPLQVKTETFGAFLTHYAALPIHPVFGAYLLSAAEFILPICLVLGFATRFVALGMLIMTALIQVYVMPDALWSAHVYWTAILLVLLAGGPGQISIDHVIRSIARR